MQKHAASRLHHDLRLEMDGVLRSWEVPKGPSRSTEDRRLAVHVEDSPMDYAEFEWVMLKGEYGRGTVMLWDRGTYVAEGGGAKAYKKGDLQFELHGARLRGRWVLARMGGKAGGGRKNWLLIKKNDAHAATGKEAAAWLAAQETSAAIRRTMGEIAEAKNTPPEVTGASGERAAIRDLLPSEVAHLPDARRIPMAEAYAPQLAKLGNDTPRGDA